VTETSTGGGDWAGTGQRARSPRLDAQARSRGTVFGGAAELYHRVRPRYPEAVYEWIGEILAEAGLTGPGRAVDVGAGTGLFGAGLRARGWEVLGVDPDPDLLTLHPDPAVLGTAEDLPVASGSASLVTVAQAWHWMDPEAASAEFRRVLSAPGAAVVVLNQLDVRTDWVLRLSRIMHAGDVYRPEWRPEFTGMGPVRAGEFRFTTPVTVDEVVALAATRTYWLRSDERIRARVEANLREFLAGEGLELAAASGAVDVRGQTEGEPVVYELPYVCLAYAAAVTPPASSPQASPPRGR
jgi:SAM-dependent methyltransferase